MKIRSKRAWLWFGSAALILTAVIVTACLCGREIVVCRYAAQTDLAEPIRIVHLTDLHGQVYGEDNEKLIDMVAQQEPDLILMTGDMLDRADEGPEVVCRLIQALTPIAPVYYGYGNHEKTWESLNGESLAPALEAAGAGVLDCAWMDVAVNGQMLRIGGYHGYYRQPSMLSDSEQQLQAETAFYDNFENTEQYKILLCHIPTAWLDWGYMDKYPVDLVLSGHYHGGQVVLPLIGPLYAPYVGLFPDYSQGIFFGEQATCVLSAGLGASPGIPRIYNAPQIVVVDLVPENAFE